MMDYKGALFGLLAAQTKKNDEELASLLEKEDGEGLKEGALDTLLQMDADRVSSLKMSDEDKQKLFDDGFKKAQGQTMKSFEKTLVDSFGIESEKQGVELVQAIVNSAVSKSPKSQVKADWTEDDIKKSSTFIDEQERWKKEVEKTASDWEQKYNEKISEFKSAQTFGFVSKSATALIDSLNPILSPDAIKAQRQKDVILNELKAGFKFDIQDERIVVLNQDGTLLKDRHENRVEFSDLVKKITTDYYDLKAATDRMTPNGGGNNGRTQPMQSGGNYDFKIPTTPDEYAKAMGDAKTTEQRINITKAWREFKTSNK